MCCGRNNKKSPKIRTIAKVKKGQEKPNKTAPNLFPGLDKPKPT